MVDRSQNKELKESLDFLKVEANNFALMFIPDSKVRLEYIRQLNNLSDSLMHEVKTGKLTPRQGAELAQATRNLIMEQMRVKTSDFGRAIAKARKPSGKKFFELEMKYSLEKYNKTPELLSTAERNQVWLEIVKSSGRTDDVIDRLMRKLGPIGKRLIVLTVVISAYNVATADDKTEAAAHEAATLSGGFLGGAAGGAAAGAVVGVFCGPGAPLCEPVTVGLGVFIGGIMGALGADCAFNFFSR